MKNKLKNLKFVFITIFALFLSNCQVEENTIMTDSKSSNYNVKNISKDEIDSNSKIVEKLQKLSTQKNSTTGKNITFDNLGLTIQTDHARYIEDGNYHSYTFATLQEDTENIKNVLFSLNEKGEYDSFLVEYDYNKLDLAKFTNNNKPGEVKMTPINLNINSLTAKSAALWVCKYEYRLVSSGDLVGAENVTSEWVLVASSCAIVYATIIGEDNSTTNYGNGTSSNTSSGYMNPTAGGGGSIATSPLFAFYDEPEIIKIEFVKKQLGLCCGLQKRYIEANGEVAFAIYDYIVKNKLSAESVSFGIWAINYLMQNPSVTISQFENWFMGTSEGQDGEYDAAYWDNPNLTFQKQNLPTFESFKNACPTRYTTAETLCNNIGGDILKMHNAVIAKGSKLNTCAIRISKALNYSGVVVPSLPDNPNGTKNTVIGADGKNYIINAKTLNSWMKKTFGTNELNYQHYNASQGGEKGINFPNLVKSKNGIYTMVSRPEIQKAWGSGHADLLEDGQCLLDCHFYDANNQFVPVDYIDLWILN